MYNHVLLLSTVLYCVVLCAESPDVMKFLRHVIRLCFPDNVDDLFNHTDGRYATSPIALLDILQRLQHRIHGCSMYRLLYRPHTGCSL